MKIPTFDHVSVLKGTVSVVSTNSSFENDNVRLPTVSFKALSDQKYELDINVDNFENWLLLIVVSLKKLLATTGKRKGIIRIKTRKNENIFR